MDTLSQVRAYRNIIRFCLILFSIYSIGNNTIVTEGRIHIRGWYIVFRICDKLILFRNLIPLVT